MCVIVLDSSGNNSASSQTSYGSLLSHCLSLDFFESVLNPFINRHISHICYKICYKDEIAWHWRRLSVVDTLRTEILGAVEEQIIQ